MAVRVSPEAHGGMRLQHRIGWPRITTARELWSGLPAEAFGTLAQDGWALGAWDGHERSSALFSANWVDTQAVRQPKVNLGKPCHA